MLAHRMYAYMKELHGGNYAWVNSIKMLLKKHMKMEMSDIKSMTQHHILVSRLHGIIRNAATHDQSMIHKLYAVMRRHGFINKNAIRNSLKTQTITSRQLLHKIKKVFKSESTS